MKTIERNSHHSDYQAYQGTGSIFPQRAAGKSLPLNPWQSGFCRDISPPKMGNRIKNKGLD